MKPSENTIPKRLGRGQLGCPGWLMFPALLALFCPVWAATIIVDETTCTLVDAVTAANTDTAVGGCPAGSGPDTIELTTDVTLTEINNNYLDFGNNALPVIETEISVDGAGFTIEKGDIWPPWVNCLRFFLVLENGTLSLKDATLSRVDSSDSAEQSEALVPPPGGWWCSIEGGSIRNRGSLVLRNTVVSVGSILNEGRSASLADSTVGHVDNYIGHAALTDCTLRHISNWHGSVSLNRCTVSGNGIPGSHPLEPEHPWSGRGIVAHGGDLTVTYSTVSGNQGGIYIGGGGQLNLAHSLVSDNHAGFGCCRTGFGGGIWCAEGSSCSVVNSTLSGNAAFEYEYMECKDPCNDPICGGQCFPVGTGGDIYASGDASVLIVNSTLFGNQGGTIRWEDSVSPPALANSIVSNTCPGSGVTDLGNNLYADCGSGFATITGLEPTLADNGGPTLTHALLPGSSAIDAGGDACDRTDQRGVYRPQDGDGDGLARCDIGSFELVGPILRVDVDSQPANLAPIDLSVIAVAILGGESFDVTDVDVMTLGFGPADAACTHDLTDEWIFDEHLRDVNLDGYLDLMTHFVTQDTGIECDDETATLSGSLIMDGMPFEGTDSVYLGECRTQRLLRRRGDGQQRHQDSPQPIQEQRVE